eukprot:4455560-Alexandrium_andersonii.AAC.1
MTGRRGARRSPFFSAPKIKRTPSAILRASSSVKTCPYRGRPLDLPSGDAHTCFRRSCPDAKIWAGSNLTGLLPGAHAL